jgi:hypothetical protein
LNKVFEPEFVAICRETNLKNHYKMLRYCFKSATKCDETKVKIVPLCPVIIPKKEQMHSELVYHRSVQNFELNNRPLIY